MTTKKKVLIIVGTRPEVIKMAPVYFALQEKKEIIPIILSTGQHRQMLDQAFSVFKITPDIDLNLMQPNQTLPQLTTMILNDVSSVLADIKPDIVLVHGDTTTCFASALAAFYQEIPVGHVEAGLRSYNLYAPWPEEMSRRLVDPICKWCFAPTLGAAENLRSERIPEQNIFVTGNTVIDALFFVRDMIAQNKPEVLGLPADVLNSHRLILVTGHRRENFGEPFKEFCMALCEIVNNNKDVVLIYPVHLNPNVQRPVKKILGREERIYLIEPIDYLSLVYLMERSCLIITDSGGIQEEAPSFGVPVLVTRKVTERPEAIKAGLAKLVGTNKESIVTNASILLSNQQVYAEMSQVSNPYGDGKASQRIVEILCQEEGGGN